MLTTKLGRWLNVVARGAGGDDIDGMGLWLGSLLVVDCDGGWTVKDGWLPGLVEGIVDTVVATEIEAAELRGDSSLSVG